MSMIIRYSSGDLIEGRVRRMLERMSRFDLEDQGTWAPNVDIFETQEAVVIVAEIAGVKKEQIHIILDKDVVRIYGKREPTCCTQGGRFHRMEIESGTFVRSFRIGPAFDPKKVHAQTDDGLLFVILPKAAANEIPV